MIRLASAQDLEAVQPSGESPLAGDTLGDFLLLAYDIAAGSSNWSHVAARLSEMLDGCAVDIFVQGASTEPTEILAGAWGRGSDHLDLCVKVARQQVCRVRRDGSIEQVVDIGTPQRPAFADPARWCAIVPGRPSYVAGERLGSSGDEYVCIACSAADGEPSPSQTMRTRMDAVLPHLARAVQIDRRLRTAAAQSFANDAILDRVSFGLFQLDRKGAVVSANAQAQAIAQQRKGLTVTPTGLHATVPTDEARLQKAIAEVLVSDAGGASRRVSIKRGMDTPPYAVLVSSIVQCRAGLSQRTACVVFVTDPDGQISPSAEAIAESFGLTPAEARVVSGLVMGVSLPNTAMRLGISINTARTLLSRAMVRTGTNSQVALVRMVLMALSLVQRDE